MPRLFSLLVCLVGLAGCAQLPEWMIRPASGLSPVDDQPAQFTFAWELSGDPEVGPLQVFDNGRQAWLQFQPGQMLPAIFAVSEQGERPLRYIRRDDYVILSPVEPVLVFRGGQLQARAIRQAKDMASSDGASRDEDTGYPETPSDAVPIADSGATSAEPVAVPDIPPLQTAALTNASFENMVPPAAVSFSLRYDDATLRHALQRWARQAGWTFAPEHWAVDVDIPVSAEADFGTVFKPAVQALLAATELSDRPVQPCFYTNQVVRVVPFTQACDRGRGEAS